MNTQVKIIYGVPVKFSTVIVHHFVMSDVDEPDLYVAQPLYEWEHSEKGQWVMDHAIEPPTWHKTVDSNTYGYRFVVTAKLSEKDQVFWHLKFESAS